MIRPNITALDLRLKRKVGGISLDKHKVKEMYRTTRIIKSLRRRGINLEYHAVTTMKPKIDVGCNEPYWLISGNTDALTDLLRNRGWVRGLREGKLFWYAIGMSAWDSKLGSYMLQTLNKHSSI